MNKKTLRIAGWALGLSVAVAGVGVAVGASMKTQVETKAVEGDSLKAYDTNSSTFSTGYKRNSGDNFIWYGQKNYFGANNATNHGNFKPTAADLPVVKAKNSSATTSTTGYYYCYTSEAVSNVGYLEIYFTAKSGSSDVKAYIVSSSTAATSDSATWSEVTMSNTSANANGANVASVGTNNKYVFTFGATETSSKYYGVVFVTSSYWRATGFKMTLLEGSTSSQSVSISYEGSKTPTYDGTNEQTVSLTADPDGFTSSDGDLLYEWTSTDTSILEATTNDAITGVFTIKGIGEAQIRVYVTDGDSEEATSTYITFTVQKPADEALYSVSITKGDGAVDTYYSDDTEVDKTGLTLNAVYKSATYGSYTREENGVAADASGVVWTLDIANEKVKVAYTVKEVTKNAEFSITVEAAPPSSVFNAESNSSNVGDGKSTTVDEITYAFAKSTGQNAPAYNSTYKEARLYNNNTLTISGSAAVQSIDQIIVTIGYTGDSKGESFSSIATNAGGSYTRNGWKFNFVDTTQVVITGGSNQLRFSSIKVIYTEVPPSDKDVESVELDKSSASLEVGQTVTLNPTVLPVDARDTGVIWESDNPSVATVENGVVTAVAAGSATITATSVDQDSISDSCDITVTAAPVVSFAPSASIGSSAKPIETLKLGDNYFNLNVDGGSYRGFESGGAARGAQFSSSTNSVTVDLQTTDLAVATKDLRVVVNASRNNNGSAYTVSAKVGDISLKCNSNSTASLTTSAAEYVFEYDGEENAIANPDGLITITLSNDGGAVYLKYVKIYSAASYSNLENLVEKLHMDYVEEIVQGEPVYLNYCNDQEHNYYGKNTDTGAKYAFNSLTSEQKSLFKTLPEYADAYARLLAWADANNDEINQGGVLDSKASAFGVVFGSHSSNETLTLIMAIFGASILAVGGFVLVTRHRKEDR